MKHTPTIRAEIEKYLKQKGLNKTEFGHIAGLNPGTVCGIVTGNRGISVNQLDRITAGMELLPDHFYERYIEECIEEEPLNWRRIGPFLYRCVQFNRLDCLQRVVFLLLDNPIYPPLLFEVAEDCFKHGYQEAAAFLYENVAESDRYQHSERLAVCQYRIFTIQIGVSEDHGGITIQRTGPETHEVLGGTSPIMEFTVDPGYGHVSIKVKNEGTSTITWSLVHKDSGNQLISKTVGKGTTLPWDSTNSFSQGLRSGRYEVQFRANGDRVEGEAWAITGQYPSDIQ